MTYGNGTYAGVAIAILSVVIMVWSLTGQINEFYPFATDLEDYVSYWQIAYITFCLGILATETEFGTHKFVIFLSMLVMTGIVLIDIGLYFFGLPRLLCLMGECLV